MHQRRFERVQQDEPDARGNEQPEHRTEHGDRGDAERRGAGETKRPKCDEHARGDARAEWASPQLIKRVRGHADREPEREQGTQDDAGIGRRREGRAEQHVRQMPCGVGRMEQRQVIAPATGPQRVERGAESHIARDRRIALGRAHDDAAAEAHAPRPDVAEARVAPVTLDLALRMRAVEALDARTEEGVHLAPLARDQPPRERHDQARIQTPQREGPG